MVSGVSKPRLSTTSTLKLFVEAPVKFACPSAVQVILLLLLVTTIDFIVASLTPLALTLTLTLDLYLTILELSPVNATVVELVSSKVMLLIDGAEPTI